MACYISCLAAMLLYTCICWPVAWGCLCTCQTLAQGQEC